MKIKYLKIFNFIYKVLDGENEEVNKISHILRDKGFSTQDSIDFAFIYHLLYQEDGNFQQLKDIDSMSMSMVLRNVANKDLAIDIIGPETINQFIEKESFIPLLLMVPSIGALIGQKIIDSLNPLEILWLLSKSDNIPLMSSVLGKKSIDKLSNDMLINLFRLNKSSDKEMDLVDLIIDNRSKKLDNFFIFVLLTTNIDYPPYQRESRSKYIKDKLVENGVKKEKINNVIKLYKIETNLIPK